MNLNELRDKAFAYAEKQGFHENVNFGERLMLVVSELSEALEANRDDEWASHWEGAEKTCWEFPCGGGSFDVEAYKSYVRGSVEEELADAIIRICDIAGIYKVDLEWHVKAKMAYNETRPYKHGRKYG